MSKSSISILAKRVSSRKGLTVAEAERFITKMFDVAKDAIQEDKQLKVKWLGTFKVTAVKDRESVDVNTGERIVIEGRDKISFTPDNILKEIVNKPFAQFETVVVNDGVDFSDIDEKFARMENGEETEEQECLSVSDVEESELEEELPVIEEDSSKEELPAIEESSNKDKDSVKTETLLEERTEIPKTGIESSEFDVETSTSEMNSAKAEVEPLKAEVANSSETPAQPLVGKAESNQNSETVGANEKVQNRNVEVTEQVSEQTSIQVTEQVSEQEQPHDNHHLVIPRYLVAIVAVVFVLLFGATFWFAFNYGKMQAQRDNLVTQLNVAKKQNAAKKAMPKKPVPPKVETDSTQLVMREKARQDSIRMAQSSNAIKAAEEAEKTEASQTTQTTHSYDNDVRIRTGAYRIVGVAQVVTVKSGQTLNSLSKRYLGEGMECYIEALNSCKVIKEGQKIKIPKLELKRKKK